MSQNRKYDISQLRDYSSLFLRNEVIRWYKNDLSTFHKKINRYDSICISKKDTYLSYLKHIYKVLQKYYPNEYVYKNEFIKKWILKEIGIADSIVFNELRLGKAIVDLAMFNGVSRAFEIKTLLDKETRLSHQLSNYSKLFNEVYLIVPECKANFYILQDLSAGIIIHEPNAGSFSLIRKASNNVNIDADTLMEVLHTHEYINIVEKYFKKLPQMNDFTKFKVCKHLIKEIPSPLLSKHFVEIMKKRKVYNTFSLKNSLLNQVCLAMNYSEIEKQKLLSNLNQTIL